MINFEKIDIYSYKELSELIINNTIENNIIIRGAEIKKIENIYEIKGSLGLSDSSIESLGDLRIIGGDFWISSNEIPSKLKSLGNIVEINGNVNLRYSNISNTGNLKKIGGSLSLRDTPINSLNIIEYIGGDLFLPKSLENKLNINSIIIKGKTKYWNDKKGSVINPQNNIFTKTKIDIPYWRNTPILIYNEINNLNYEQKQFYYEFKQNFLNNKYIDLKGNNNYAILLLYYFINQLEFSHNKEIINNIEKLNSIYKKTMLSELIIGEDLIIDFEEKNKYSILNGLHICIIGGYNHLTQFGKENIFNIISYANKQLEIFEKEQGKYFFELFYKNWVPYVSISNNNNNYLNFIRKNIKKDYSDLYYPPDYYKKFYLCEKDFEHYYSIDKDQIVKNISSYYKHTIRNAIVNLCRLLLIKAEDLYRDSIGMPKIGEGWISETELFYKVSQAFPKYKIIHHGKPKWLGKQHLDIFIPELMIGIEYQGEQHYKAVDFFGGEEAFKKNKERDEIKKQKCIENGLFLIFVDKGYVFEDVRTKIVEIIKTNHNKQ